MTDHLIGKSQSNIAIPDMNDKSTNGSVKSQSEDNDKYFLYSLSKNGSLDHFKYILLFSSH